MKAVNLSGSWNLKGSRVEKNNYGITDGKEYKIKIPGTVQDTFIDEKIVPDPYYADNELETLFIGRSDWDIYRTFDLKKENLKWILRLEKVDTVATLFVNGSAVSSFDNEHRIFEIDLTDFLRDGSNTIEFRFTSSETLALERNSKLKYPVPCSRYMNDSPNRNLVRKAQCNAAWDWGLCLQSIGIHEDVILYGCENVYYKSFSAVPVLDHGNWTLKFKVYTQAFKKCETEITCSVTGFETRKTVELAKGSNCSEMYLTVPEEAVEKWWPNGYGTQTLYSVSVSVGSETKTRNIGFRTIEVKNGTTFGGKELVVCVNGQDIFCKGANWIPLDARSGLMNRDRYFDILEDARFANMNMLRVWGGGWYEKEDFYDACDQYGILLWHDLMFSCSTYPAEKWFLESVKEELIDQIRRLASRTCIALWCGNNECLGALTWYEETIANRERYLKDYEKLYTDWIDKIITEEDQDRMYWPSSPCAGPGDYSDNWHSDGNGDMHYWSVWHERKDFEDYHNVKPRFCSEFGYQSFPSLSEVKSFAPDDQLNLTSPVMESHQRNQDGNSIIIEMFARYFRMPGSFENQLYLSQVQQALAIETAVIYWRSLMPYCMGTLYWQLNDVWPVSSWSSIEYSGKYKALHYSARRFYRGVTPLMYKTGDKVFVKVANDTKDNAKTDCVLQLISFSGETVWEKKKKVEVKSISVEDVFELELDDIDTEGCFLTVSAAGTESCLLLTRPKAARLENPNLSVDEISQNKEGFSVKLSDTKPAFFVMLDAGNIRGRFTDNNFMLNGSKTVNFECKEKVTLQEFRKALRVYNLYSSSEDV